ncbi:MAG TPA: PAAR domain-containing protein [Nitrososphaera sp.]|nr:PAAR domain-containing protein [Nitrososphaera sp.]
MPPAARIGDMTSHGTPLAPGPGAPTVLIGGKPAWRIGDFHTCPLFNGNVPHVGGVLTPGNGCLTVLIMGQPAAKVGDAILEPSGGPNAIVSGEPTVMICG